MAGPTKKALASRVGTGSGSDISSGTTTTATRSPAWISNDAGQSHDFVREPQGGRPLTTLVSILRSSSGPRWRSWACEA